MWKVRWIVMGKYRLWIMGKSALLAKFNDKEIKPFKDMAYSKGHFSHFWALKLFSDVRFYTGCLFISCLIMTMYRKRFLSCPASVTYSFIQSWPLTPPSSKVKNKWSCTSTPHMFYGLERENFTSLCCHVGAIFWKLLKLDLHRVTIRKSLNPPFFCLWKRRDI